MGDIDRGQGGLGDDDRLPWLEAVENEEDESALGIGKLIVLAVLALVAIGLIVGGVLWLREGLRSPGDGSVIAAPEGPYKVPADPTGAGKGMAIEGVGDATYAASQGVDVRATIDTTRQPEQPVTAGGAPDAAVPHIDRHAIAPAGTVGAVALPPSGQPLAKPLEVARATVPPPQRPVAKPAPAPAPAAPAVQREPASPAVSGPAATKQIGAYSSMAKAEAGRRDLQGRFPALGRLNLSIRSGTSNGNPVYRIFMTGPKARVDSVCAALHSAKEGCIPG